MDASKYLGRTYGQPPCWELVADVYATEYSSGVGRYAVTTGTIREAAQKFALHIATDPHGFTRLASPSEGCVVLLGSPRAGLHHAGVYTDGKLLHALRESVFLEPLESVADRYKLIEFWGRP